MRIDEGKSAMGNQSSEGDWIVQGVRRLDGEVARFSDGVSRVERKLDRLQYATIAFLGLGFITLALTLMPLFGVKLGG